MKWIPKILSLVMLWGALGAVILFIEPDLLKDIIIPGSYLPFFILLTLTIWYTLAVFIKPIWKSLLLTLTVVGYIVLLTLHLMYGALAIMLLLTLVIESWYIYRSHEKIKSTHEPKDRGSGL